MTAINYDNYIKVVSAEGYCLKLQDRSGCFAECAVPLDYDLSTIREIKQE